MVSELTQHEKNYFDGLLQGADGGLLTLKRMTLDDEDVAVIMLKVVNRFTRRPEGLMPLAILVDPPTVNRLRGPGGEGPKSFSPHEVDT